VKSSHVKMELPRFEGDQEVTTLGSNPTNAARGTFYGVPLSILWRVRFVHALLLGADCGARVVSWSDECADLWDVLRQAQQEIRDGSISVFGLIPAARMMMQMADRGCRRC
jgi:hypothetical protein